jgi:hypothetical protein
MEEAQYNNIVAARAEGLRQLAEQLNGDGNDAFVTGQERLSALRAERGRNS